MQLLPRNKALRGCCNHSLNRTSTKDRQAGHWWKWGYHLEIVPLAKVLPSSNESFSPCLSDLFDEYGCLLDAVTQCLEQRASVEESLTWHPVLDAAPCHRESMREPDSSWQTGTGKRKRDSGLQLSKRQPQWPISQSQVPLFEAPSGDQALSIEPGFTPRHLHRSTALAPSFKSLM